MYVNGLVVGKEVPERLWSRVRANPLSGQEWPLSLELNHLGLPPATPISLAGESAMSMLHDAKATLIDWDAIPKVFAEAPPGLPPDSAIEDYTADYGVSRYQQGDEQNGDDEIEW
jgi:hypothetical protein